MGIARSQSSEGNQLSNTTVVIMIGNSDDKLSQLEWAEYIKDVDQAVLLSMESIDNDSHLHGRWFSLADSPYQNAAWCAEIKTTQPFR